jgi:hypothetical protein
MENINNLLIVVSNHKFYRNYRTYTVMSDNDVVSVTYLSDSASWEHIVIFDTKVRIRHANKYLPEQWNYMASCNGEKPEWYDTIIRKNIKEDNIRFFNMAGTVIAEQHAIEDDSFDDY